MNIIPYTIIATGLYSGLISSISTLTTSACKNISHIYNHDNPDIYLDLKRLDINRKLNLINSILSYRQNNKSEETYEIIKAEYQNNPVMLCLEYLSDIIADINIDLINIKEKINRHDNKYFRNWRNLNIKPYMDKLELDNQILDQRFISLVQVCQINNLLYQQTKKIE